MLDTRAVAAAAEARAREASAHAARLSEGASGLAADVTLLHARMQVRGGAGGAGWGVGGAWLSGRRRGSVRVRTHSLTVLPSHSLTHRLAHARHAGLHGMQVSRRGAFALWIYDCQHCVR